MHKHLNYWLEHHFITGKKPAHKREKENKGRKNDKSWNSQNEEIPDRQF